MMSTPTGFTPERPADADTPDTEEVIEVIKASAQEQRSAAERLETKPEVSDKDSSRAEAFRKAGANTEKAIERIKADDDAVRAQLDRRDPVNVPDNLKWVPESAASLVKGMLPKQQIKTELRDHAIETARIAEKIARPGVDTIAMGAVNQAELCIANMPPEAEAQDVQSWFPEGPDIGATADYSEKQQQIFAASIPIEKAVSEGSRRSKASEAAQKRAHAARAAAEAQLLEAKALELEAEAIDAAEDEVLVGMQAPAETEEATAAADESQALDAQIEELQRRKASLTVCRPAKQDGPPGKDSRIKCR